VITGRNNLNKPGRKKKEHVERNRGSSEEWKKVQEASTAFSRRG